MTGHPAGKPIVSPPVVLTGLFVVCSQARRPRAPPSLVARSSLLSPGGAAPRPLAGRAGLSGRLRELVDEPDRLLHRCVNVLDRASPHDPPGQVPGQDALKGHEDRVMVPVALGRRAQGRVEDPPEALVERDVDLGRVRVRGHLHDEEHLVELRLDLERADRLPEEVTEPVALGAFGGRGGLYPPREGRLPLVEDRGEQMLLRGEVPVQRRERDLGVLGHVRDLDALVVAGDEPAQGGLDDAVAPGPLARPEPIGRRQPHRLSSHARHLLASTAPPRPRSVKYYWILTLAVAAQLWLRRKLLARTGI